MSGDGNDAATGNSDLDWEIFEILCKDDSDVSDTKFDLIYQTTDAHIPMSHALNPWKVRILKLAEV